LSARGSIATPAAAPPAPAATLEAVLLATTAFEDGPTAALPCGDTTVVERLRGQLASLGATGIHVIARPGMVEGAEGRIASDGLAEDLRTIARIARAGAGPLVISLGDVIAHREALAGLLADPRLDTAILAGGPTNRPWGVRLRVRRSRVMSAGSAYHRVRYPNARFLEVLKVAPQDRATLAEQAERLAELVSPPDEAWERALDDKIDAWRDWLGSLDADGLTPEREAQLRRRREAMANDACALLLVGLVRAQVRVGISQIRQLTATRPLTRDAAARAAAKLATIDEDKVLLDSAVKFADGFFTTFFVSPYSRYIARWAARRGFTPNQITIFSLALGILAAAAFAIGSRAGLVAGAVLLQVAFTFDCVDGQLARYTRQFSALGAWLDSVFDRAKEYIVYAGLAIGSTQAGENAWILAAAALALQTFRHQIDFAYTASRQRQLGTRAQPPLAQPSDMLLGRNAKAPSRAEEDDLRATPAPAPRPAGRRRSLRSLVRAWSSTARIPGALWIRKMIAFPIGERFAAISLTAALGSARLTFGVLLIWGAIAAVYTLIGRTIRSLA
jgi:phosphatidylglycerophosphate synthase